VSLDVHHTAGARQINHVTASTTPATAGIGGAPARKIAVKRAIMPVPIVNTMRRCLVSGVKRDFVIS
jgi:hypothetical protein